MEDVKERFLDYIDWMLDRRDDERDFFKEAVGG